MSLPISKAHIFYAEYSLSHFCIVKIISKSNQSLEYGLSLSFFVGATESITLMNLFTKSECAIFTQVISSSLEN